MPFDDPKLRAAKAYTKLLADTISPAKSGAELDSFPWLLNIPILKEFYLRRFQKLNKFSQPIVEDMIAKELVRNYILFRTTHVLHRVANLEHHQPIFVLNLVST